MKLYNIVSKSRVGVHNSTEYRFISCVNNCRGRWHYKEAAAKKEGEAHQKIMIAIYPALSSLCNDNS